MLRLKYQRMKVFTLIALLALSFVARSYEYECDEPEVACVTTLCEWKTKTEDIFWCMEQVIMGNYHRSCRERDACL